jgi:hypothetical protein
MTSTTKEIIWLRWLLVDMSFLFSSYSYVLWKPEFYSDCSQLGFSWTN